MSSGGLLLKISESDQAADNSCCYAVQDAGVEGGIYAMVPARRPPTPEAVQAWLHALRASRGQQPSQSDLPASFAMDPNTGKLLPGEASSKRSCIHISLGRAG